MDRSLVIASVFLIMLAIVAITEWHARKREDARKVRDAKPFGPQHSNCRCTIGRGGPGGSGHARFDPKAMQGRGGRGDGVLIVEYVNEIGETVRLHSKDPSPEGEIVGHYTPRPGEPVEVLTDLSGLVLVRDAYGISAQFVARKQPYTEYFAARETRVWQTQYAYPANCERPFVRPWKPHNAAASQ